MTAEIAEIEGCLWREKINIMWIPLNYSLWIAKTIEVDYRMLSCCIRPNAAYWRISLACPVQSQGYILSIPDVSSHCLLYVYGFNSRPCEKYLSDF